MYTGKTKLCPRMLVGGIYKKIPFSSQGFPRIYSGGGRLAYAKM